MVTSASFENEELVRVISANQTIEFGHRDTQPHLRIYLDDTCCLNKLVTISCLIYTWFDLIIKHWMGFVPIWVSSRKKPVQVTCLNISYSNLLSQN